MEISAIRTATATEMPYQRPVSLDAQDRELIRAVKKVNESALLGSGSELTFLLDRETKKLVVRIVDRETKEVIQQIPGEQVLRLASNS